MQRLASGRRARYVIGPLEIVLDDMLVAVAGRRLRLTRRELELLLVLADQAGRPVPRAHIHARVWGTSVAGHKDRSVEVYIRRLRVKLAAAASEWITSIPTTTSVIDWSRSRDGAGDASRSVTFYQHLSMQLP